MRAARVANDPAGRGFLRHTGSKIVTDTSEEDSEDECVCYTSHMRRRGMRTGRRDLAFIAN
ncbi:hypothetical protein CDAR_25771, partial [Caerostris darwini]